jgi:hypothetical protein
MTLLGDDDLERSAVVANCRMNRGRNLTGSNGYAKEIGFSPLDFLKERGVSGRPTAWLDLCCGSGKALIEAARIVHEDRLGKGLEKRKPPCILRSPHQEPQETGICGLPPR